MKKLALLVLLASTNVSYGQEAPKPQFAPFTVSETDLKSLESFLQEQPFKFSAPIMQWLAQLEQRALAEAKQTEVKPTPKTPAAPDVPPPAEPAK